MPSLMTNGSSTIYAEIEDKLKKSIKLDNKSNEVHQTKLFTTPQKRRLRSNSMPDDPISSISPISSFPKHCSPPVCKSPRRCMNSSPNGNSLEICNGSDEKVWKSPKLPKSPRVCINSSPNGKRIGIGHGSDTRIGKSPRKKLSDSFTEKPKWNPKDREQIGAVKEALHVSMAPSEVVCREEEQKRVLEFCKDSIQKEKGGSLYLCGCPGTGKTLSMEKVKQSLLGWVQEEGFHSPSILAMNCTSLPSTSDVFTKILEMYPPRKKINGASSALQHLKKLFSQKQSSSGKMTLIIADELDYLITKDRSVLHDLFMLTTFPFSTCILIGIANAIDLADRFLPKLKALNCKPMIITFRAYSIDQILRILRQRLKALPYDVFHPKALEFCARKVAAASGDMRKVLCVCRSAIEMLEAELRDIDKEMSLMQPANVPSTQSPPPATECSTKKIIDIVNIDHMALALSQTFKSAVVDTIQALPQHQQVILCSMVKLFRRDKKDTTVGELNKSYCEICKLTQVPQASFLEFSNMCRVLSDQGLLKIGQAKEDRLKRVTLKIDEADIKFALQGIRFFRTCLQ